MCPYIFGNTFTFCTDIPFAVHFNCAEKILHLREELQHMTIVHIFFYLSLKYNLYFHSILWFLETLMQQLLLTLYLLLSPARNYFICNPCPPWGGGRERVGFGQFYCITIFAHINRPLVSSAFVQLPHSTCPCAQDTERA